MASKNIIQKKKKKKHGKHGTGRFFIVLGFNDTSTLAGHFVSSPREREKRDRRDSRETGKTEEQELK